MSQKFSAEALAKMSPEVRRLNAHLFREAEEQTQRMAGIFDSASQQIAEAKSEKQLQGQLEGLLRRTGIRFPIRPRTDRKSTINEGAPDIMFSYPGIGPVAWEVKMPGKNPCPEQTKAHEEMKADGWRVYIVRSYDEGLAILESFKHPHRYVVGEWSKSDNPKSL